MEYTETHEVCPHCEKEAVLQAELKVQTCPNCATRIVTRSMCRAVSNLKENYCTNFCLAYQADAENKENMDI